MDSCLREITTRYLMLHMLATELAPDPARNDTVCKEVYSLFQDDQYFKDSAITAESLQTVGFMKNARNDWDLLQTSFAVGP